MSNRVPAMRDTVSRDSGTALSRSSVPRGILSPPGQRDRTLLLYRVSRCPAQVMPCPWELSSPVENPAFSEQLHRELAVEMFQTLRRLVGRATIAWKTRHLGAGQ